MTKNKRDYSFTQNRELSWLNFNRRCLEESLDDTVPLFEKLNFIKIFCTNLDEFCMVRIGSLSDLALLGNNEADNKSDMTPKDQLSAVFSKLHDLYGTKDRVFQKVEKQFRKIGIANLSIDELSKSQLKAIYKYFSDYISPILSPLQLSYHRPLPFLENKSEYMILQLKRKDKKDKKEKISFGVVPIPSILPKILPLPGPKGFPFIRTSKVLFEFVDECYPRHTVSNKTIVRVTRNADLSPDDEINYEDSDYRTLMKRILKERNRLQAVRVEVNEKNLEPFRDFLCKELKLSPDQILESESPLSMDYVSELEEALGHDVLSLYTYGRYSPRLGPDLGFEGDLIQRLKERDYTLFYPYDSMDSYLKLMEQAAEDSRVVSIKITIYRLAKNSRLVEYLCRAAENGKEVMVLMELRARFDEQNNLDYSKQLYEAGCNIIYGIGGYKVHSKVTLITLKDSDSWSYITQIGTGNYNESTAKAYSDICLMTSHRGIGMDAVKFFRNMQVGNLNGTYDFLLQAPSGLKDKLLGYIDREIEKGDGGYIFLKMNSLTDRDFIDKLSLASNSGVKVKLIIRGINCILPGIAGKTENIEAHSIVGRFLEHARVYVFGKENPNIFIGSADLMTRNTEHRVEILTPVFDKIAREKIMFFMDTEFDDNVKGRKFLSDGDMHKISEDDRLISSQNVFMEKAAMSDANAALFRKKMNKGKSIFSRIKEFFNKN